MIDRGAGDHARPPGALGGGGEREHAELVGLGAAAGQDDLLARAAEQRGDLAARALEPIADPPALAVQRGRVAQLRHRRDHRRSRMGVQWSCRVEVQVDPPVR